MIACFDEFPLLFLPSAALSLLTCSFGSTISTLSGLIEIYFVCFIFLLLLHRSHWHWAESAALELTQQRRVRHALKKVNVRCQGIFWSGSKVDSLFDIQQYYTNSFFFHLHVPIPMRWSSFHTQHTSCVSEESAELCHKKWGDRKRCDVNLSNFIRSQPQP